MHYCDCENYPTVADCEAAGGYEYEDCIRDGHCECGDGIHECNHLIPPSSPPAPAASPADVEPCEDKKKKCFQKACATAKKAKKCKLTCGMCTPPCQNKKSDNYCAKKVGKCNKKKIKKKCKLACGQCD